MEADTFRRITGMILVSLTLLCSAENPRQADGREQKEPAQQEMAQPATAVGRLTVYYFHANARCATCNMFENVTRDVVQKNFADQLTAGEIVFSCVNIEEEPNRHYVQDYRLYTKSVVLSMAKDGRETSWKNLDKIWELARDQDGLRAYIRAGIAAMLEG